MRWVFVLIAFAGLGLGFFYPWYVGNFSGREIGNWAAYQPGAGFQPVTRRLTEADAPVRVLVDLTAVEIPEFAQTRTILTLTAASGGQTVLAETLTFSELKPREKSPQLREKVYRDEGGVIPDIVDGEYTFVIGQGDADGIQVRAVDLILRGGVGVVDPRAQPIGFSLAAIGLVGFVLASRRRRRDKRPDAPPPGSSTGPRWGRGGDRSAR